MKTCHFYNWHVLNNELPAPCTAASFSNTRYPVRGTHSASMLSDPFPPSACAQYRILPRTTELPHTSHLWIPVLPPSVVLLQYRVLPRTTE